MHNIHLLIIDNDQVNSFVLKNIIARNYDDVTVTILTDGALALDHLKGLDQEKSQSFPAIILLDIYMPVMNGFQFLDEYSKLFSNKPTAVFAMSNSLVKEDQQRANDYSVVKGYITKPLIYNNIQFVIESFLENNPNEDNDSYA